MIDREKVIKGLEYCTAPGRNCDMRCPYVDKDDCEVCLERDALALLNEQEPVRPWQVSSMYPWFKCGACQKPIEYEHMFCPFCGHEVKWHE